MRRRLIYYPCLVALAIAALTALEASGAAAALKPDPVVHVFRLRDSNGYSLYVSGFSERADGKGEVGITVGGKGTFASYRTSGTLTSSSVKADFGALGQIDVVLKPSGRLKKFRRKCWRPTLYEPGVYEGIIRFNGERGYARARQTEAPLVPLPIGPACGSSSGEASRPGLPGARLRGVSYAHGRVLKFQLNKNHRRGRTLFSAEITERRNGISIRREVEGFVGAAAFDYAPELRTASLRPPAPFSGAASLRRSSDSVSPIWTGNLALDFPGRTHVALTGRDVHVSLAPACFTRSNSSSVTSC